MSRAAERAPRPKEQPQNCCVACRKWVLSQEVVQLFAGEGLRPQTWRCPACRAPQGSPQEGPPEGPGGDSSPVRPARRVPVPPGPETRVIDPDTAEHRERRYGPLRQIVGVLIQNQNSRRVMLECHHEATTNNHAKAARCGQCRVKE